MTTVTLLKNKEEILKEREGKRVKRYLHVLFGRTKFGFNWTNAQTSYTDGKDVYAKYDIERPHRTFTLPEKQIIRRATSVHERGHIEYDILEVYMNWQQEWASKDKDEWLRNEKYPISWLQYFGNVLLDGRMENFTAIDHPETKTDLEFKNYEWKCAPIESVDRMQDFRQMYMCRSMGMEDFAWDQEAIDLIETVQPLIEQGRTAPTTAACLSACTDIMKAVWPTLLEWMDLESQEPNGFEYSDGVSADTKWGDSDEVEQNVQRVMVRIAVVTSSGSKGEDGEGDEGDEKASGSSAGSETDENGESENGEGSSGDNDSEKGEDSKGKGKGEPKGDSEEEGSSGTSSGSEEEGEDKPSKPDFTALLAKAERDSKADEQEASEEVGPYLRVELDVEIDEHREDRKAYSSKVIVQPYNRQNLARYTAVKNQMKRHIHPTAKALKQLLDPVADETIKNQRSGRVNVAKVWRTEKLGDTNVFQRKVKGTPAKDARILTLQDISGSTGGKFHGSDIRIVDEMRKAQILLVEACEEAKIPVAAYAFTEDNDTEIYPLKPYGRYGQLEKEFIGGVEAELGNRDTLALQWAVNELSKYNEDIRLLIVLSDGEPCFDSDEDKDTMRAIVQQAEKQGIDVLVLYVGPQNPRTIDMVRHMYPGGAIIVDQNLARELSKHVKRIIRKRRGCDFSFQVRKVANKLRILFQLG